MKYVIAGNHDEFLQYLAQTRTKPEDAVEIGAAGARRLPPVEAITLFGSWGNRDNVANLVKRMRAKVVEVTLTRKETDR